MMKRIVSITLICAGLLAYGSCASAPSQPLPPPDVAGSVDFAEIVRFSRAYQVMRHGTDGQIHAALDPLYDSLELVDLPKTKNRYMIGTLSGGHRQEIWIRGTANFRNAVYDLRFAKRRNGKLGINLHAGFEKMALAVYQDILPRLKPDYDLVIFGHSLGAAEAVILGMLLQTDGCRVKRVYASGQPRVTDAEGEKKFDSLPVLRIMNDGDPVPFLPPRDVPSFADPYVHLGDAVILLDGPYYCLIGEDRRNEDLAASFWQLLSADDTFNPVKEHLIPAYLSRLEPKIASAVQVPFDERAAYVATEGGK
jgi:triacylglycerol lipase